MQCAMLKECSDIDKIYIAIGFTDLRLGIDSLVYLINEQFGLDPLKKGTLFLFCGRRSDRIKCLCYEGDGFLLLYKRLNMGYRFSWPRTEKEAREMTRSEFNDLMRGINPYQAGLIKETELTRIG